MIDYRVRLERIERDILGTRRVYEVSREIAIAEQLLGGTLAPGREILHGAFEECLRRAGEQDIYLAAPTRGQDPLIFQGQRVEYAWLDEAPARPTRPAPRTTHTGW